MPAHVLRLSRTDPFDALRQHVQNGMIYARLIRRLIDFSAIDCRQPSRYATEENYYA